MEIIKKEGILDLISELYTQENCFLSYEVAVHYLSPFGIEANNKCATIKTTVNFEDTISDKHVVYSPAGKSSVYGIHAHDVPSLILERFNIPCDANFIGRGKMFRARLECLENYFRNNPLSL